MMMMASCVMNTLLLLALSMIPVIHAKDPELICGACHMLVDEISWGISQTDPRRTIQVGSFRIMPDGSQRLNEIPYKRSEVQLSELLDTACGRPDGYFRTTDKSSSRKIYRRQNRRDGQPSALTSVSISKEITKMLKFACEGLAEDYEEEIIAAFKIKTDENYLKSVCVGIADACTEDQLYDVDPEIAAETESQEQDGDNADSDSEEEDRSSEIDNNSSEESAEKSDDTSSTEHSSDDGAKPSTAKTEL